MTDLEIGYLGSEEGYKAAKDILPNSFSLIHVVLEDRDSAARLTHCHAIIDASMRYEFSADFFDVASKLKIISTATTGSDHIDYEAALRKGVRILTLKEFPSVLRELTPAAEMTWTLLMALARNLIGAVQHTRDGEWLREQFPGVMLKGKVLGILGCGRIGGWVARYANAFGMDVIGFDPHRKENLEGVRQVSKNEIATHADFISVHVHLNEETTGLVDRAFLERMKKSAFLINTSRGAIVDENALLELLERKRIAGYGSDVLSSEPNVQSDPLICYSKSHNNVLITPHCGGNSPDAVQVVCAHAAREVLNFFEKNA